MRVTVIVWGEDEVTLEKKWTVVVVGGGGGRVAGMMLLYCRWREGESNGVIR